MVRLLAGRSVRRLTAAGLACVMAASVWTILPAGEADAAEPPPGVMAIGDSIMLGARWLLRRDGVRVDARVSRQATSAPGIMRRMGARLPAVVVVHLGTNGTFPSSTCRDIVRIAGPNRRVYLLTIKVPRRWERSNNAAIRACARQHPDRVSVIDWNWAASRHRGWLYGDGFHLRPDGARGYARVIHDALARSQG
ncbi:MAG: hypothetical protein KGP12_07250 [Actinomycetales bacterium]|nr:hypothetical protein [Actinomycetales bacterium]